MYNTPLFKKKKKNCWIMFDQLSLLEEKGQIEID